MSKVVDGIFIVPFTWVLIVKDKHTPCWKWCSLALKPLKHPFSSTELESLRGPVKKNLEMNLQKTFHVYPPLQCFLDVHFNAIFVCSSHVWRQENVQKTGLFCIVSLNFSQIWRMFLVPIQLVGKFDFWPITTYVLHTDMDYSLLLASCQLQAMNGFWNPCVFTHSAFGAWWKNN